MNFLCDHRVLFRFLSVTDYSKGQPDAKFGEMRGKRTVTSLKTAGYFA